jgi:hypothetical protein
MREPDRWAWRPAPDRLWKIGVLANAPWPPLEGLRDGLRELGYVEGKTRDLAMFNLALIASFAAAMSWPVQRTGSVTSQALLGGTASFRRGSYLNKVRDLGAARRTNGALNARDDGDVLVAAAAAPDNS